uniref:Zinc finger GRF-type domain-containing protein n=1 Tax=Brassica oleracea var. oleracea TaxID=109376 RepID=A0A0D3CA40_BRAOL
MGVNPYDTSSWHVSTKQWPRDIASKQRKKRIRAISRATPTVGDLVVLIDVGLSPRRAEMDPAEEIRETKRQKDYIDMVGYVADSENGIPTRCPCGGTIIHEVRGKDDYNTLPGKRFFTCKNYEADGLHYRQPWVIGVEEHIERLSKRLEEVEMVIKWMSELTKQIERLETEVKDLTVQVDNLNGEVYNLSVQVGRVNEQVCKFVGSHEAALKEQASGQNENDVMKAAHDIFFNDYHAKFTLEHSWRELRFDQKWKSHSLSREGAKEKRKEPAEEVAGEEDVRPPGIKASKASKRKKHGNEAAFDQIESILAAKNHISKQKILDRLLAKNEDKLSAQEMSRVAGGCVWRWMLVR